jgi:hypothetical protein
MTEIRPKAAPEEQRAKEEKEERLAEALRANLARRKAQSRTRAQTPPGPDPAKTKE